MITQKDLFALIDIILAFKFQILIPRIICYGSMLHESGVSIIPVYRIRVDHAALIFELWILIPRIVLWLATPSDHSSHGYQSFESFFLSVCSAASLLE
jgi:hypothetical protein